MEGIRTAVTRPLYMSSFDEVHSPQTNSIWDLPEVLEDVTSDRDDTDSMSRGSMSPDLSDMWHQEPAGTSPQWEGGLELNF